MTYRDEIIQDAIRFLDEQEGRYTPELMADFLLKHPLVRTLESLREAVGTWCECCPVEVQRSLHAVHGIEKTHDSHPFEEPEARMQRLTSSQKGRG